MTFQYALWDRFKVLSSLSQVNQTNLCRLCAHLISSKALSLAVLRVSLYQLPPETSFGGARLLVDYLTSFLMMLRSLRLQNLQNWIRQEWSFTSNFCDPYSVTILKIFAGIRQCYPMRHCKSLLSFGLAICYLSDKWVDKLHAWQLIRSNMQISL